MEVYRRTNGIEIAILIAAFAVLTIVVRLMPHAPNMTPLGALALVAGMYLRGRWTWAIPLSILAATDLVLGAYAWQVMLAVYGSFALVTLIGRALRSSTSIVQVVIGASASSVLFFVVTNFAVWAWTPMYEKTWGGLMLAYTLAVPFFRNMFVGDLVSTTSFLSIIFVTQILCQRILLKRATT